MSNQLTANPKPSKNLTTNTNFIESIPFPPLGTDAELVVYDENNNNFSIPLEDWQLKTIQQVLGLVYNEETDTLTQFTKESVQKRLKNIPELHIVTNKF